MSTSILWKSCQGIQILAAVTSKRALKFVCSRRTCVCQGIVISWKFSIRKHRGRLTFFWTKFWIFYVIGWEDYCINYRSPWILWFLNYCSDKLSDRWDFWCLLDLQLQFNLPSSQDEWVGQSINYFCSQYGVFAFEEGNVQIKVAWVSFSVVHGQGGQDRGKRT